MKKIFLLLFFAVAGVYAQTEQVKFEAKIQNRNSDSLIIRSQKKVITTIKADKKGNYKGAFAAEPGFYQIFDGTEGSMVYLKNGYDLNLTMDAKQFDESIVYKGKGAKENNLLAKKALEDEVLGNSLQSALSNPDALTKMLAERTAKYTAAVNDKDIDENFKKLFLQQIAAEEQQLRGVAQKAGEAQKMKGKPSATFAYENYKGGSTKLEDFKGKYVYIDVWATWCGPCRAEIPHLQKTEEKYHGKNIEFVSISVDVAKDHDKWKKFVGDKTLGGTQLIADKDWSSDFIQSYGINSIPRFILIGPDGKIVEADAARPSDPALQAQLDQLLK
jgi:thiol-disulfide isomerase/thioredoxin